MVTANIWPAIQIEIGMGQHIAKAGFVSGRLHLDIQLTWPRNAITDLKNTIAWQAGLAVG